VRNILNQLLYTVIPRSYDAVVSETGYVIPEDVTREGFPYKLNVRMEREIPGNLFALRKKDIFIYLFIIFICI
jgi:hypothetical protein